MPHNGNCKRVWILGAGFSYPVGAPLFGDLFGDAYANLSGSIRKRYEDTNEGDGVRREHFRHVAKTVYQDGVEKHFWRNPEEFLQRATDCMKGRVEHPLWGWLFHQCTLASAPTSMDGSDRETISMDSVLAFKDRKDRFVVETIDAAREEIAVEVSLFLYGADFASEKWIPYKHWMESLTGCDTVLTFNYDQGVEMIRKNTTYPDALNRPVPSRVEIDPRYPTLFKLHGSAGWKMKKQRPAESLEIANTIEVEECDELLDFLRDYSYRPLIFTPGPEKMELSRSTGYWLPAMQSLREAEEIHIVGYRFPDTDCFAQQEIVSALADNSHCTAVNIVLGPDIGKPEVRRVRRIISATGKRPRALEVYTQDYLKPAVVGRDFGED